MRTCALAIVAAAVAVLAPSSAAAQQPVADQSSYQAYAPDEEE